MLNELSPWHLIIILLLFALLFGAKRLPDAARGLGRSMRIFRAEMQSARDETPTGAPTTAAAQAAPAAAPVTDAVPQQAAAPATETATPVSDIVQPVIPPAVTAAAAKPSAD